MQESACASQLDVNASGDELEVFTEIEMEEHQRILDESGPHGVDVLRSAETSSINVGITGQASCGKSTLVNTLRGLTPDHIEAAPVGRVCTTGIRSYRHPKYPFVVLWDLPGAGTTSFPIETYLKDVGFDKYDFLLILTRTRLTENDFWLARKASLRRKPYVVVRTKIDADVEDHRADFPDTFDERRVLNMVRKHCISTLERNNCTADLFIISGKIKNVTKWDFPELNKRLVQDMIGIKRQAMILAISANSKELIEEKYKALRSRIYVTAGAFTTAKQTYPRPCRTVTDDIQLLLDEVGMYRTQLSLDEKSLDRLSDAHNIPLQQLQACVYSLLPRECIANSAEFIEKLLGEMAMNSPLKGVARCTPIVGAAVTADLSYSTAVVVLRRILYDAKKAALNVLGFVMERSRMSVE